MRCPRCAYKGKLFQGKCAVCGYPLEEETQETTENSIAAVQQPFLQVSDQYPLITNSYAAILHPPPITPRRPKRLLGAGDTLHNGRYRLQDSITLPVSQQSHGMAWNAFDLHVASRFVVIREINFSDELTVTPAQKEFNANKIAQRLTHLGKLPGLPHVCDMFSENDSYFLVFLYPQGETLATLLKRWQNGLPEHLVTEYAWQLCDVLIALGEQEPPLVHGAICPETILISEEGKQAILMYLPLLPPKESSENIDDTTSIYRAPEQVHGMITPASDLYALAATLYHAVTGADPQERPPAFYPPARRLNQTISPAMELILARELRLTVAQRYSGPQEMQQDIAALLETFATQATRAVVPLQPSEVPLLSLDNENGKKRKINADIMRLIVPVSIGIVVVIILLLLIALHR